MAKCILNKSGYLIPKDNVELVKEIKNELTVTPYNSYNKKKAESFQVFLENNKYICVPKYYGLSKMGIPEKNKEFNGLPTLMEFKGDLRPAQKPIMDSILNSIEDKGGGLLNLACGQGKCLGFNTPVLLYDGSIKMVQDIRENHILMGDDNKPRIVSSISYGFDTMFKVLDLDSKFYYKVNSFHILTLIYIGNNCIYFKDKQIKKNDLIDISIEEYFINYHLMNYFYGIRKRTEFEEKTIHIDPFIFGTKLDEYVDIDWIQSIKYNSIKVRERFIEGIILNNKIITYNDEYYSIIINNEILFESIIYVIRSLGIRIFNNIHFYYDSNQNVDFGHIYPIEITQLEYDNYYGFTVNDNGRFLLGDFTITHNTVLALYVACKLKVKTLVIVHKTFLLNQWKARTEEFTTAKIGIIQRDKVEVEGNDIVLGMLQSIAKNKYDYDIFNQFGLVIFDEAHHAPSKYFSQALPIISCRKTLALSATPKRADRLEKVLFWYFGDIIYKSKSETMDQVLVKIYNYNITHKDFREFKCSYGQEVNRPKTISKLIEIKKRNEFIITILKELLIEPDRKIIILSDRLEHLNILKKNLDNLEITITSLYIGGLKQKILDEAEKAQVIFATYSMAAEALDIPTLNTLVMVTPRKEIEQAVGRITRKKDHLVQPIIIDIVDKIDCFYSQSVSRMKFYNLKDFTIKISDVLENDIIKEITLEKKIKENNDYDFI
jgi:superfamily II DNA or RNA helicase